MANTDKLWFEIGLRDEVTRQLEAIIGKANDVRRAFATVLKDPLIAPGIKEGYNNVEKLEQAIERIGGALRSIRGAKLEITDPKDIANLNRMQLELGKMRSRIVKFLEDVKREPVAIKSEGLADAFLSSIGFNAAISQTTNRTTEYTQQQRNATRATREYAQAMQGLSDAYNKVTTSARNTNSIMEQTKAQLSSMIGLYSLEHLVKSVIQVGGEFEQQHIALQAILGDVQQANSMFEQMKELAVVSPFNFRQLAAYSKQVAAFGIPYEEMYDTTKRLADMSAGLGVDMGRLILAYGQVRSAAVLRGQELRQFTEAGIPMVKALAEEFTKLNGRVVSTAEVFELIQKRSVPFEMVKKVLWDMTNEGGRFYDMQFVLSDTLLGKWSNLRDAWEIMLSDFAKGESLSGKALKTLVSWTTTLVETMNSLTPIITGVVSSIGIIKAANWIGGKRNLGFTGIDRNIENAQRLRAVELARQKINGEITRQKYSQLMAENTQKGNYYKAIAFEGKLNAFQIQKAYRQGYINQKELTYLVQLRLITAEERKQIILNKLNASLWGRATYAVKGFFTSLKASLGPMGIFLILVDAAVTAFLTWKNRADQIAEKNKDLSESFKNNAEELKNASESMTKTPTTDDEYKNAIDGMKELLKQHSGNYKEILLEANGLKDLREQYELLKNEISSLKDTYTKAEEAAPDFADATRGQFKDIKEWARKLSRNNNSGRFAFSFDGKNFQFLRNEDIFNNEVKELADKIKISIPNVGMDKAANELYYQLREGLEQELGYGSKEKILVNVKLDELLNIQGDGTLADIVTEKFTSAIDLAEPRIANKIRYGQHLEEAEKNKVKELVNNAIEDTEKQYPLFAKRLQELLDNSNFSALITLNYSLNGNANDLQNFVYGNFPIFTDEKIKKIATGWATGGSMYEARNNAKRDIDAKYNEKLARQRALDKLKKDKKAAQAQIDAAQKLVNTSETEYNELIQAAKYGIGYDYEGEKKKSNKDPKSNQKDEELTQAKTQLDEVKKFYAEYEKYRKTYGPEKGQSLVEDIFGMDKGAGTDIIKNYKSKLLGILEDLEKKGGLNSEERKKFRTSVLQTVAEIDLASTKQVIDRELKELQEHISRQTENWNLYKSIFEKTGNRELAQSAFRNGRVWDDLSREFSDELSVRIGEAGKSIDLAELLNMTSAGAEEYLKDVDGAYALWQKINELTRGGYRKYLEDSASALGDILTYEEKVVAAENKLKDIRSMKDENGNTLYGEGSPVIIKAMRELRKAEDEAFEHSADYVKFYNSILSMTISEAEAIGQKIRENLDKSLQDGTKSAKQYQQAIKQIEEQLKKIRSRQTDLGAFMYGGADKLIKNQYEKAESDFNDSVDRMERARKDYDKAIRKDDKEGMKGAEARMEAAEASKNAAAAEMQAASAQMAAIDEASRLVHLINDSVQAINDSFNNIKAIFDSEGVDTESGSWGEWGTTLGVFSNISSKITAAFDAMKNGNPAGAISNLTGAVSSWFTGFNSAWDAKMERQIKIAQEHLNATKRLKDSIERKLGRTLGGIYKYQIGDRSRAELTEAMNRMTKVDAKTFSNRAGKGALYAEVASQIIGSMSFPYAVTAGIIGSRSKKIAVPYYQEDTRNKMSKALESGSYYDEQMALLYKQRDELGWQLFNLYRKKKKDWPAIAEMLQQIEEVGDQIENAALDLANTIYGIDLHSWASELTEAIVSAWESGEDAVEAYGKKVEEIVKTLTTKILSQSVVESALKSIGIEELIENALSDDGVIDVDEAAEIGNILKTTSENVATSVQNILDAQEAAGAIERGNGSSSASGSIKNITENTADLLASYINAIRADVSVNRVTLDRILASVEKHGEMPVIAQAQLDQLRTLVSLARERTVFVSEIRDILHKNVNGGNRFNI